MWYFLFFMALDPKPGFQAVSSPANAGRRVYEKSGCPACHTRFVRNTVADMIRFRPDDYLKADISPATGLLKFQSRNPDVFSRRIGPDLEYLTASSTNDEFLMNYIKNPQAVFKHSVMPAYAALFHEKLTDDEIFFASGTQKNKVAFEKYTRGEALMDYLKGTSENGI